MSCALNAWPGDTPQTQDPGRVSMAINLSNVGVTMSFAPSPRKITIDTWYKSTIPSQWGFIIVHVGIAIINHPFLMVYIIPPIYGDSGNGLLLLYHHYNIMSML